MMEEEVFGGQFSKRYVSTLSLLKNISCEMTLLKDVIDANAKIRKEYKDLDDREKDQNISFFNVNEAQVVKLVDNKDLKSLEGNFVPVQVNPGHQTKHKA